MVQFASDLTDLIILRYEEMRKYPQYAESVPHWIERAGRKMEQLMGFVNQQNALADAGNPPEPVATTEESQNGEGVETEDADRILTETGFTETPHQAAELATEEAYEAGKQPEPETVTVPVENLRVLVTSVRELTETVNHQSKVIIDFKDALLEHVDAQKAMLDQILNAQTTGEGVQGKPLSPREELNDLPDSLVQ